MSKDKKHYELTPISLLAIEIDKTLADTTLIFHSLKRYARSIKRNAIIFTKDDEIIFAKVRKSK